MDNNPLQALQSLQPPLLFAGLPKLIGGFMWIFWTAGFILIVAGHVFRVGESGNDPRSAVNNWTKTMLVLVFMMISPTLVQWGVDGMQDIQDTSGVGSPVQVTRKAIRLAFTFPELETVFSSFSKTQQAPPQAAGSPNPVAQAVSEGGIWGYTKAFFIAMGQEATDVATNSKRFFNAMVDGPALIAALITAGLKAIAIVLAGGMLYLFMIGAGIIVWFIDALRYFLLVTGALLLPTFIAGYNTKSFSSQAHNYVTWMVSVILWPFGWMLGNIGTVGLFNAYVSLISGTSLVSSAQATASNFVNNFSWDNIDKTVGNGSVALLWGGGALAAGASAPFLYLLLVGLGALFLFLWIMMVHIGGPIFVTKMVTMGASFFGQAAGATLKSGAGFLGGAMKFGGKNAAGVGSVGGGGGGSIGGAAGGMGAAVGGAVLTELASAGAEAANAGTEAASNGSSSRTRGGSSGRSSGGRAAAASGDSASKKFAASTGSAASMAGAVKAAAASLKGGGKTALSLFSAASMLDGLSKVGDDPSAMGNAMVGGLHDYLGAQVTKQESGDELGQAEQQTEMMREQTALMRKIASSVGGRKG